MCFSSLHFKKATAEQEKAQGWASEVIRKLEAWAGRKYWDLQSKGAEAKKGGDRSLKQGKGRYGEHACDHKILGDHTLEGL